MRIPVNLAVRPLRNERLPSALVGTLAVLVLVASVWHVGEIRRLVGQQATALDAELQRLEAQIASSEAEIAQAGKTQANAEALARWAEIAGVVERRAFAWTSVLAAFERALPPDVRIVSLSPSLEKGELVLQVSASARNIDAATGPDGLVASLMRSPDFATVLLSSLSQADGGVSIQLSIKGKAGRK